MKAAGRRRLAVWGAVGVVVVGALVVAMLPRPEPVDLRRRSIAGGWPSRSITKAGPASTIGTSCRPRCPAACCGLDLRPGDPVTARETVLATFVPAAPALLDARSLAEARSRVRGGRGGSRAGPRRARTGTGRQRVRPVGEPARPRASPIRASRRRSSSRLPTPRRAPGPGRSMRRAPPSRWPSATWRPPGPPSSSRQATAARNPAGASAC